MVQSSFINNLYRKYGVDRATPGIGGEFYTTTNLKQVELKIDLTTLNQNEVIIDDNIFLPAGIRIQEVEVVATTAAATGVAIDLGLTKTSDRATEVDFDGLLAAYPTASMDATGEKNVLSKGSSNAGALIGSTLAFNSMISCSATTATAFTAGVIVVRIRYYKP